MNKKRTFTSILLILTVMLMFLPFLATFNDVLTRIVIKLDAYKFIRDYVVPWEVRMVGVILYPFGFKPQVAGDYLAIGGGTPFYIEIAWNCVGWQSLLFFVITAFVGLQGERYTNLSKIKCLAIGLLGTFLINLGRIALVTLVTFYFGQAVGAIIHDYGSTLIVIGWLMFFWWFSYSFILEDKTDTV